MTNAIYSSRPQAFHYSPGQTARVSSRDSYPTFLPVYDSALLQLTWAWRGLCDAFRWDIAFSAISRCVCGPNTAVSRCLADLYCPTRPSATPRYGPTYTSHFCLTRCPCYRSMFLICYSRRLFRASRNGSTGT